MAEKQILQINLSKIHLILGIAVLLFSMLTPFITGFVTISKNTEDIGRHDTRIQTLETDKVDNHDLLLELKFNLKKHMIAAGEDYIDMSNTNAN